MCACTLGRCCIRVSVPRQLAGRVGGGVVFHLSPTLISISRPPNFYFQLLPSFHVSNVECLLPFRVSVLTRPLCFQAFLPSLPHTVVDWHLYPDSKMFKKLKSRNLSLPQAPNRPHRRWYPNQAYPGDPVWPAGVPGCGASGWGLFEGRHAWRSGFLDQDAARDVPPHPVQT